MAQAQESAKRLEEDAKLAINVEVERAVRSLRREAGRAAVDRARGLLEDKVDSSTQSRLSQDFIQQFDQGGAQ